MLHSSRGPAPITCSDPNIPDGSGTDRAVISVLQRYKRCNLERARIRLREAPMIGDVSTMQGLCRSEACYALMRPDLSIDGRTWLTEGLEACRKLAARRENACRTPANVERARNEVEAGMRAFDVVTGVW